MAIVVFNGKSYECARAVKGVDYIKLYDENNAQIIAFWGISDFSAFTLTEGEWETGVSTQTVAAYAELVNGVIQLTLLKSVSVETGLTVTFQAPCDCTESNGVSILGVNYTLVDAAGVALEAEFKAFAQNAMVRVILNTDENKAYIQNGAATTIEAGGTGANNAADALNNLGGVSAKGGKVKGVLEIEESFSKEGILRLKHTSNNSKSEFSLSGNSGEYALAEWLVASNSGKSASLKINAINNTLLFSDGTRTYNIFGEHNKPDGSYTGSTASERTVNIGGKGSILLISSDNGMVLVSNRGGIYKGSSDTTVYGFDSQVVRFYDGVLTINTDANGGHNARLLNTEGYTYWYQVL